MENATYKTVGWVLIVFGIIAILLTFFNALYFQCSTCTALDYLYEFGGYALLAVLLLVLVVLPGRVYSRVIEGSKSMNRSLGFAIASLLFLVLYLLHSLYIIMMVSGQDWATGMFMMFSYYYVWPVVILYGIAVLFLAINWLQNR